MRIERIHIGGFGCLADRTYEFPANRAVLVLEDNESGKSTLAAAILACLCGFPARKQAGEKIKLLDAYRPWTGDIYKVEMDITAGGRRYRVERDFARGSYVVRDPETNIDITAQCDSDLAKHFLHLPREDFSRVAFMSGKEMRQFSSSANIQARLSALMEGSGDQTGGDLAIATLEATGYSLGGRQLKTETAIKRLTDEIAAKQSAIRALDAIMEAAGEDAARLDQARTRRDELSGRMVTLDTEYRSARLQEVRERISAAKSSAGDADMLALELHDLEEYMTFPAERRGQLDGAVARAEERKRHAQSLDDKHSSLEREADEIRARTEAASRFAEVSDNTPEMLMGCEVSLKNALQECAGKREAVSIERRALSAEGVDPEALRDQWSRFERMASTDREFLKFSRERELEIVAIEREADAHVTECSAKLGDIKRDRAVLARTGKTLLAAGGLCGLTAVGLMVMRTIGIGPSVALVAVAVTVMMIGFARLTRSSSLKADEKAAIERAVQEAHRRAEDAAARRESNIERLRGIAQLVGYDDPQRLVEDFRQYERAAGRSESLNALTAQLAQAEESLQSAQDRAMLALRRLEISAETIELPETLAQTRESLSKFLNDQQQLARLERELAGLSGEIERAKAGAEEELKVARAILEDAKIDNSLPLDEALKQFAESEKLYRRYREIKDSLLPTAMKHIAPGQALQSLIAEEHELTQAGVSEMESSRASGEIESDRRATRTLLDEAAAEVSKLEKQVGASVDAYRADYPALQEDLDRLQRELAKATRFGEAIRTATEVMKEVSRESRRQWATALNARATSILPHLNGDYDTLKFDDTLSFTIRNIAESKIIEKESIDACLSTGAKDQVYLAARLACCGELSADGESIPILLDDPLMAADDSRFTSGLEFLVKELTREHQVIILSCHKSRHSRLLDDQWFAGITVVLEL